MNRLAQIKENWLNVITPVLFENFWNRSLVVKSCEISQSPLPNKKYFAKISVKFIIAKISEILEHKHLKPLCKQSSKSKHILRQTIACISMQCILHILLQKIQAVLRRFAIIFKNECLSASDSRIETSGREKPPM